MGQKILSSLGLGVTGRTFVTKTNCTPASHGSAVENPLFSIESSLEDTPSGACGAEDRRSGCILSACRRVTIPGKTARSLPFHGDAEYARGAEDSPKTEFDVGSLILAVRAAKSSPVESGDQETAIQPSGAKHVTSLVRLEPPAMLVPLVPLVRKVQLVRQV